MYNAILRKGDYRPILIAYVLYIYDFSSPEVEGISTRPKRAQMKGNN